MNETTGTLTVVAYRDKGTYGNVSVFFYAQNLEAQQGLDYNTSETVKQRCNESGYMCSAHKEGRFPPSLTTLSSFRCFSSSTANDINM